MGCFGSALGTSRSAPAILVTSISNPASLFRNLLPVIMSNILGVYALIVSIVILQSISRPGMTADKEPYNTYSLHTALCHLSAGIMCGFTCLVSGAAIGTMGGAYVKVRSFVCVCACVRACACVCVCAREREREALGPC